MLEGSGKLLGRKKPRESVPDYLTREKNVADLATGLFHPTISQDQTSGSQFSRESLAALSNPLDEADIALVFHPQRNQDIY